jgi:hypothetical protein
MFGINKKVEIKKEPQEEWSVGVMRRARERREAEEEARKLRSGIQEIKKDPVGVEEDKKEEENRQVIRIIEGEYTDKEKKEEDVSGGSMESSSLESRTGNTSSENKDALLIRYDNEEKKRGRVRNVKINIRRYARSLVWQDMQGAQLLGRTAESVITKVVSLAELKERHLIAHIAKRLGYEVIMSEDLNRYDREVKYKSYRIGMMPVVNNKQWDGKCKWYFMIPKSVDENKEGGKIIVN